LQAAAARLATEVASADRPLAESEATERVPAAVVFALQQGKSPGVTARLLRELSVTYEFQVRNRLSCMHGFVEPISICIVAGLAGFLFLALVAPLVSLVQNLS
jgi:type II secretory pathway component PulF